MARNKDKDEAQVQAEMLVREAQEEVRYENIKETLNKWKWPIVGIVAVLIISATVFEGYKAYRLNTRMTESNLYEQAAVLNAQGKSDEAMAVYKQLVDAKTNYKYLAQMRIAGIYFEQGKEQDGLALLNRLRQEKDVPANLKAVVDLSYVGHQLETGNVAELQGILNPYMMPGNAFYGTAAELSSLLLLREGKNEAAKKLLTDTIGAQTLPETVRLRLQALLSVIDK